MSSILNFGILAHVDAGKTTLTEQMLFHSGAIRKAGSVDSGSAHTDPMEVERMRGISVRACSAQITHSGMDINLIDTPGHMDFSGEIERSLRALDNAVLIVSAVEGVQSQTEVIWKALEALKIPVIFFINKIDRAGADVARVMDEIKKHFGVMLLPMGFSFEVAHLEAELPSKAVALPISFPFETTPPDAIQEALAEKDIDLLERYLDDPTSITPINWHSALTAQYRGRDAFPVLCGAAAKGEGVLQLMDIMTSIGQPAVVHNNGPVSGVVYRIEHHKSLGRLAHIRMYSGKIENRDVLINTTKGTKEMSFEKESNDGNEPKLKSLETTNSEAKGLEEKVSQIKKYSGIKLVDAGLLQAGETGVVCGLSEASVGTVYGAAEFVREGHSLTKALISVQVFPETEAQYPALLEATSELNAEDPLLDMVWVKEQRALVLSITGTVQMEVLVAIYRQRFGLEVTLGEPSVIYKETPSGVGEGYEAYTMPKPCCAIIRFKIEPLPPGSGVVYESEIGPVVLPLRYQAQIEQAIPDALKQGPRGWEITDCKITLIDGNSHVYHTHPLDFITTTPMALLNGLAAIGTDLLEPMLAFTLKTPEKLASKILGEITNMRGRFHETEMAGGQFTVWGLYPLSQGMDFPQRVAALTSGRGVLTTSLSHYEKCPPGVEATQPYRGVSPLDRAKYILSIRGAL